MRPAGDQVTRPAGEVVQRTHRVDDPFDALSRTEQPPGQQCRPTEPPRRGDPGWDGRAVRNRGDLPRIDVEADTESLPGCRRHHDHLIRGRRDFLENRTLVWRRVFENRVGDDDGRNTQPGDDVDDIVAVDTAVDAVLVLDHRDVILVQHVGAGRDRRCRTVGELPDDPRVRRRLAVGHLNDANLDAIRAQPVGQRSAERRQPAARRRICAENTQTYWARGDLGRNGTEQRRRKTRSIQKNPNLRLLPAYPA